MRKVIIELSVTEQAKAVLEQATRAIQAFASKFKVKISEIDIEVKQPSGLADSGDLETDLPDLFVAVGEAAKRQGRTVVIALDEMQYLPDADLAALITAIHKINQKSLPIGFFGAGLPHLLAKAGKAKSYSERLFQFVEIGALEPKDAERATREPIVSAGADIDPDALKFIVAKSQGYPYFIQEWGFRTWNEAAHSPITESDAIAVEGKIVESLDKSFFRVRFDQLTESEKLYLRAMAELGPGPHKSGDISKVLGKDVKQTGTVRAKVIAKGMAYGGQYGVTNFSVPLFDEFMRREMADFRSPKIK